MILRYSIGASWENVMTTVENSEYMYVSSEVKMCVKKVRITTQIALKLIFPT